MYVPNEVIEKVCRFPRITVEATIFDRSGRLVHTLRYRLWEDAERRAAGERIHDVLAQGYEVRTRKVGAFYSTGRQGRYV